MISIYVPSFQPVLTSRRADFPSLAFLVGLAPGDCHDQPIVRFVHIAYVEGNKFAATNAEAGGSFDQRADVAARPERSMFSNS